MSKNFRKISKPEIQVCTFALFFSGAFRVSVYSVEKSEKTENQMTLWEFVPPRNFRGVFSGFQDFQLRIRVKFRKKAFFDVLEKKALKSPAVPTVHFYMRRKSEHRSQKTDTFFRILHFKNYKCAEISGRKYS
jgi:hypothetical protein